MIFGRITDQTKDLALTTIGSFVIQENVRKYR